MQVRAEKQIMNRELLKEQILLALKSRGKKRFNRRELYRILKQKNLDYNEFKQVLTELETSGAVERTQGRKVSIPAREDVLTGVFKGSRSGGGRVVLPDGETILIRKTRTGGAMPGDTVKVKQASHAHFGVSALGSVVGIVERSSKPLIALFQRRGPTSFVIPQDEVLPHNILVRQGAEKDARQDQLVVCRLLMPQPGFTHPVCEVTEVLGDPDAPGVDVLAIAKRHELPIEFSEEAMREAESIPDEIPPEMFTTRRDIRDLLTVTIDPVTAKDFDDAVTIARLDGGGFRLGVHIADVSSYVRPRGALDRDAEERGASCYLVDRVIPMLPRKLSNNVCSLNPRVDRLTKSMFAEIDRNGEIRRSECVNTVMRSDMRLTYEQVQAYLEGKHTDDADAVTPDIGEMLRALSDLAGILIRRRVERGALDFDIPETQIVLDRQGKPVDVKKRERLYAHRMIEEAMLCANTVVAQTLGTIRAPLLYRVHDVPNRERLEAFGEAVRAFGYTLDTKRASDPHYLQSFLTTIRGTRHEYLLNLLLLRSMKKAMYSPENIGHYGLELDTYTHFTSPIRRYPDLVTHRQLDAYLILKKPDGTDQSVEYFMLLGEHATNREIVIDAAERESIKMKAAEFMSQFLGEEFEGSISGIMPNGFFVELDKYFVEGLVHVRSLADDYYEKDPAGFEMVGRNHGRKFMIGDQVTISVVRANKQMGEIDFEFIRKHKKKERGQERQFVS